MYWIAQLLKFMKMFYGVPCGLSAEVMRASSACAYE